MKNRGLIISLLAIALTGCAGAALKNTWKDERGYTEADIDAIMEQQRTYGNMMGSALSTTTRIEASNRLRAIFCTCARKMGNKCRTKEGAKIDRESWIKANAVDITFSAYGSLEPGGVAAQLPDTAECGN